jgi:phosphonate transport system substrate-binding protein
MRNIIVFALLATLPACTAKTSESDTKAVIRITGVPDENPTELQRKIRPMVNYLQKALGAEVKYIPVTDYGAAVQALVAGQIDFAWLGGFTHVQSRNLSKVVPLTMRDVDRGFKSVFIANTASGVNSIADIKGKKFAFGSKSSTSGHMMPRHFLSTEFKIDSARAFDGEPVFSGAHDATAKIVETGRVAAGVLNSAVWKRLVASNKIDTSKVKVIWTTPSYVDYVWTASHAVSSDLRDKFKAAFLTLDPANVEHRAVLALQSANKFVEASPSDFDAIEAVAKSIGMLK